MIELLNYISDTKNGQYNFALGRWYENQGHLAAATGYYIRTTEFSKDELLIYEALLRIAICLLGQGARVFVSKGVLLRAIALNTERPEAYFLLSQCCEQNKDWSEAYTYACLGEKVCANPVDDLKTNVGYPGKYVFTFEKAVSAWWLGLYDESIYLFRQLKKNTKMLPIYNDAVQRNLNNLSDSFKAPIEYIKQMYPRLKYKFQGSNTIEKNYSQCYQDMFVLAVSNGKKNGKFLEIGCGDPFFGNNTYLLEKEFGWTGISIDIDKDITNKFSENRLAKVITADATNMTHYLQGDYDYLQVDCDPCTNSLKALYNIPFNNHKFSVITFEHDFYTDETSGVKENAKKFLESLGYELIVSNIAPNKYNSFEDWYVHKDFITEEVIKMKNTDDTPKKADLYMLN